MELVRSHFIFSGRVQGVGFRYRASYAARGLGITGWVRNCTDGSVEMETQGNREQINRLLKMLNHEAYIRIDRIEQKDMPPVEHETGFRVRGY